jgi:lipid-binding SYLF domain-containing protein
MQRAILSHDPPPSVLCARMSATDSCSEADILSRRLDMKRSLQSLGVVAICAIALSACAAPGASDDAQRAATMRMHDEVLAAATARWPVLQDQIDRSDGYAVVNGGVLKVFLLGLSSGYGVIMDQGTRTPTMIDTFGISLGPGIEFSNTSGIVVFHTREALDAALSGDAGWVFGGTASLGLEIGDFGGDLAAAGVSGATSTYRNMEYGIGIHAQVFLLDVDVDTELQ